MPRFFASHHALRGLAALGVMVFHFGLIFNAQVACVMCHARALKHLYLLVDFFFLLSGFILCHLYAVPSPRPGHWRRYAIARVARLLPLHYAVLAIMALGALSGLALGVIDPPLGPHYPWAGLPASALLIHSWGLFPGNVWNVPSWSISAELVVYLLFPLLSGLLFRYRHLPWLAIALGLGGFGAIWIVHGTLDLFGLYGVLRSVSGFVLGMGLYRLYLRFQPFVAVFARNGLAEFCLVMLLAAWWLEHDLAAMIVFGVLVVASAADQGPFARIARSAPLRKLGDLSYAIYMTHWPVSLLYWASLTKIDGPMLIDIALTACFLFLTLCLSWAAHHWIERPARDRLRAKLASAQQVTGQP